MNEKAVFFIWLQHGFNFTINNYWETSVYIVETDYMLTVRVLHNGVRHIVTSRPSIRVGAYTQRAVGHLL